MTQVHLPASKLNYYNYNTSFAIWLGFFVDTAPCHTTMTGLPMNTPSAAPPTGLRQSRSFY
jgi:hypothetical protein